jgi:group II intron reverse transcriptase/maturase
MRRVEIPKPGGGVRMLGIPTVLDRLLQQALHQVLTPIFDPTLSDASFGFRPGRGAHDAVVRPREHIAAGCRRGGGLDVAKFFDTVNHDVLMRLVAQRVKDKLVLRLIGRYLQAGMLVGGVTAPRTEGTPQGGPLSPLLSNILLDELDRELERRGHRFVRYADDCNVYVRSRAAGERVMASLESFLTKRLRPQVNRDKSAVARPWDRTFLGYSFTVDREPKLKAARRSVQRLKDKLRAVLRAARGRRLTSTAATLVPHHPGMDGVLPVELGRERVRGTGPVAEAEAARCVVAAVEAATHPGPRTAAPWADNGPCTPQRLQRPGTVVERGSQPHERGRPDLGPAPAWPRELRLGTPAPCALHLNRRMPNGTYGGVGGGAGNDPASPIMRGGAAGQVPQ